MSESGWINRGILEEYVTSHLARYAALNTTMDDNPDTLTRWTHESSPPDNDHIGI
ncbi:hypothetical protein DPMN_167054 [Dreissena polymorpha]|uniref:Uncharacterized protein n=1 Tax=Dreissena polymorpha TaxID=45954 RepID=A0A9D4EY23_DREPO|nr:hypothetical protein DPMN_167054 [Dreissena polymorpha]